MLSDNIRKYRKENNLSQDELAEKLNVSRQSVSLWETGQTQPTIDNIISLSTILNVSADDLLKDEKESVKKENPMSKEPKKKRVWLGIVCVVIVAAVTVCAVLWINGLKQPGNVPANNTQETGENERPDNPPAESSGTEEGGDKNPEDPAVTEKTDLFDYCKNFAVQIGELYGDYTIYSQPSDLYGGDENNSFSISYWADSDMVEFALHCPQDDTFSVNFYLRMRGGYDGEYEYLTSYYYREDGESVCYAVGKIDPAAFRENYPLPCDRYEGSADVQNDFMEMSRLGMCNLIKCLKQFAEVEKMDCGFEAFDFVNF